MCQFAKIQIIKIKQLLVMKKTIITLILAISFTFSFAQKANVSKAKNKALTEESPDFAGAREAIKLALADTTTNKQAETWYVAGLIGYKESEALYKKQILNQAIDTLKKGKAILESYPYFLEALKLDSMPDAKGKIKPKYTKQIKEMLKDYYSTQLNLFAYGAYLLQKKKDYPAAINAWEVYMAIPNLPVFNKELKMDSTYKLIKFYTALTAVDAKITTKSIPLLESLKHDSYETAEVYRQLSNVYLSVKDSANYLTTLKEGLEKLPNDAWFLQNLINYYIYSGKTKDALVYLNTAIEREPQMAQYRYVKGNLDEAIGNVDEAIASFDKALKLDSTLAEAWGGKGRLYYNKAVKMSDEANLIKDVKQYNAEMKNVDAAFKVSIPFFQKASQLKPTEMEFKRTLKTLYYRLKKDPIYEAKYDAISKEIEAMK
jgi:tetratricopeptide (TPR) repeat protein